ncbi:Endonuclease/exonuclease/phosphatase [Ganoderma leucocontextum]|nr:Endonuclease/exonuclease/phosphatase [Ganoderma leucocontextum]
MDRHLKAFVGAFTKLALAAPSIRVFAPKVPMSSQNSADSSNATAGDKPTTTLEDAQAINAVESDQDPPKAKLDGDDNSGSSEPSSPGSPSHSSHSPDSDPSRVDSSRSDSDEDKDAYGTHAMENDTIRDLRIKAFSPEESRWTTKYDTRSQPVPHLRIVSWNVDFMAADTASRVSCILDHLKKAVLTKHPQPTAVLLQELDEASFAQLLEHRWVREHFAVTPPNTRRWPASYGLATLVSRHARVENARMLQFRRTVMGRAALFVDVSLRTADAGERYVVRIANTHLESLPIGERARPAQLCAIADMLREPGIHAGIVGGDMNMIGPADQHIHVTAGLHDASSDGPESDTWGYQPPSRFPPGRLDRIFYTPCPDLVVQPVKVIGKGLKTKRGQWASDHYGLQTTIALRQDNDSDMSH